MRTQLILAGMALVGLTFTASASVQITKFDPPLVISTIANPYPQPGQPFPNFVFGPDQIFRVLAMDFNLDGQPDFNLAGTMDPLGFPGIDFFFNTPAQMVIKPSVGTVAGLPFWTVVGPSLGFAHNYKWSAGSTNQFVGGTAYGSNELVVAYVPSVVPFGPFNGNYPIILTAGQPAREIPIIGPGLQHTYPFLEGDVVGKKGIMAVALSYNGEIHYGYIEFDFRPNPSSSYGNMGGLIYGWAFETDPGQPIIAAPFEEHGGGLRF